MMNATFDMHDFMICCGRSAGGRADEWVHCQQLQLSHAFANASGRLRLPTAHRFCKHKLKREVIL